MSYHMDGNRSQIKLGVFLISMNSLAVHSHQDCILRIFNRLSMTITRRCEVIDRTAGVCYCAVLTAIHTSKQPSIPPALRFKVIPVGSPRSCLQSESCLLHLVRDSFVYYSNTMSSCHLKWTVVSYRFR